MTRRKRVLLAWLEAHEHRQDPGENGRRIEHFIGENEHLYQIIGRRPVYCQKLINGPGRGNDRWRKQEGEGKEEEGRWRSRIVYIASEFYIAPYSGQ